MCCVVGACVILVGGALQVLLDRRNDLLGFESRPMVALAVVATVALTVFVMWELADDRPIGNLRWFRHRNFAAGTFAVVWAFGLFFSVSLLLPRWMQNT